MNIGERYTAANEATPEDIAALREKLLRHDVSPGGGELARTYPIARPDEDTYARMFGGLTRDTAALFEQAGYPALTDADQTELMDLLHAFLHGPKEGQ